MVETFVVGDGLEVRLVDPKTLREQEVNAQVMKPRQFSQLVENVKARGQLESLPYCAQPDPDGPIEIVSGHHRVRAAIAAQLKLIPALVDTRPQTRSAIVAKQIAHNALVGESDAEVLRRMIDTIDNPDDLLATGLEPDQLPTPDASTDFIGPPSVDFEWRNLTFTFVPRQFDKFDDLCKTVDGRQDLIGVAPLECFDNFARAVAKFARIRDIRSIGTAIATLTDIATAELADIDEPADPTWVPLAKIVGTTSIPPDVAALLQQLIQKLETAGDITPNARWRALELAAADLLAAP